MIDRSFCRQTKARQVVPCEQVLQIVKVLFLFLKIKKKQLILKNKKTSQHFASRLIPVQ